MNQQAASAKEFDEAVIQYNEWLSSFENPKAQRANLWRAFIQGMGSVLGVSNRSSSQVGYTIPLYSRDDLTSAQKDAIALASDWQRVGRTLDKFLSRDPPNGDISVEDATQGKKLVQQMYEHFRDVYVANSMI